MNVICGRGRVKRVLGNEDSRNHPFTLSHCRRLADSFLCRAKNPVSSGGD